ncbi:hypothetical protein B0H10DRAFT_1950783 [Mycena sp. CBHHK59/15]|nr:hypothetical protein B0H10DRAFT_1950783 [Mycena sp. CBHHK59/15]
MSPLPSARIPAPIPDSFDFDAWVIPPPSKNPAGQTLQLRNQHNLHAERFNETSIYQTLNCKEDRVAYPDVGPPLKVFYTYTAKDMAEMVLSEGYCTDVGPLPAFICREVEHARRKKTDHTEAEKVDKEKLKGQPFTGVMVLSEPIVRVPGQRPLVCIPEVVFHSILNKLYVPLHWFSDRCLQRIQFQLHDTPTKLLRPEPTLEISNLDKVIVLDMLKMTQLDNWGSDELHPCMSPLTRQQAAVNMEAALEILSEVPAARDLLKPTFVSEFRKHCLFFTHYENFEENYSDWYPFKREARHSILRGVVFDCGWPFACQAGIY